LVQHNVEYSTIEYRNTLLSSTDLLGQLEISPCCLVQFKVDNSNIQRLNTEILEFWVQKYWGKYRLPLVACGPTQCGIFKYSTIEYRSFLLSYCLVQFNIEYSNIQQYSNIRVQKYWDHYRLPLVAWSSSMHSKRALKLPAPKPWWLCLWITSMKTVGRSCKGFVKIWRRYPLSS